MAGIVFAWWGNEDQRRHAELLAREQHEHERRLARGERLFDRRAEAYEGLLRQLQRALLTVDRTHPIVGPKPPPPDPPTDEEWGAMLARVAVLGSEELMDAFELFVSKVNQFHIYASTYTRVRDQGASIGDTTKQMERFRVEARQALTATEKRMREELAGF